MFSLYSGEVTSKLFSILSTNDFDYFLDPIIIDNETKMPNHYNRENEIISLVVSINLILFPTLPYIYVYNSTF